MYTNIKRQNTLERKIKKKITFQSPVNHTREFTTCSEFLIVYYLSSPYNVMLPIYFIPPLLFNMLSMCINIFSYRLYIIWKHKNKNKKQHLRYSNNEKMIFDDIFACSALLCLHDKMRYFHVTNATRIEL